MTIDKVENIENIESEASPPARLKVLRRILLAAFFVLLLAILFVGLRISVGYVLGSLAALSLVVALTCRWQRIRNYLLLIVITVFAAIIISMIHVEVIARIVRSLFGEAAFDSTGWKVFDVLVSNILLFFVPACIFVGIGGSIVLYVRRIISRIQKKALD